MYSKEKRNWFLFILGYFLCGYLLINWVNQFRANYIDISLPFEKGIPFIPLFVFGYALVYFCMFLLYFILDEKNEFRRAIVGYLLITTFHYMIFLIFPVKNNMRPDILVMKNTAVWLTKLYYLIDLPYNCFPSLHVAYPSLAIFTLWARHRKMSVLFAFLTALVAVSVIFVKQHYILDVVAGFLSSMIIYKITALTENRWQKYFTG